MARPDLAIAGALLVVVWLLLDRTGPLGIDSGVALVSGFGAIVFAAGVHDDRLAPWTRR